MNNKYILTILAFLLMMPASVFAQDEKSEQEVKTFNIGLVPQYSILGGMRTDLDFRLNSKNHWLIVSPIFHYDDSNNGFGDYEKMFGVGIELQHRIFLHKNDPLPTGAYFGYGPVFNFYSVDNDGLFSLID